jgi:hypothetical protein
MMGKGKRDIQWRFAIQQHRKPAAGFFYPEPHSRKNSL